MQPHEAERINSWLTTIPNTTNVSSTKRKHAQQQQSPPGSLFDEMETPKRKKARAGEREKDDNNATPRPLVLGCRDATTRLAAPPASSPIVSSDAASLTTASGTRKRKSRLEVVEDGVVWTDIAHATGPAANLIINIVRIVDWRQPFLPPSVKAQVGLFAARLRSSRRRRRQQPLPALFMPSRIQFHEGQFSHAWYPECDLDTAEAEDRRLPGCYPSLPQICEVLAAGARLSCCHHDEAAWTSQVHLKLLEFVFANPSAKKESMEEDVPEEEEEDGDDDVDDGDDSNDPFGEVGLIDTAPGIGHGLTGYTQWFVATTPTLLAAC